MHFSEGIENTLQMFATEQQFESHIRSLISEKIISKSPNLMLLQNKDVVYIIICKNSVLPQLFFIEAKFHTSTKNRIGFGDGRGGGFQPEILSKRPIFFDNYMRWVFGRENDLNYYI
ncbi:MAG: hypothetical protein LH609_12200, partial [Rudanella sp.]|nr:hypothetical protein [Rudanella sp.]